MATEKRISFPFRGRFFQLGEAGKDTREIVFVLHGHGQLAQYFIRKFQGLDNGTRIVYAPEGLSRYYLEGFTGRVGATWMTREDRENDIINYITYLDQLYESEAATWPENVRIHVIGFSQGAATATRWILNGKMKADRLILWAGILPYDMDIGKSREILTEMDTISVHGTRDPYLTDETTREMTQLADKSGAAFEYHTFDGEHVIDEEMLLALFTPGGPSSPSPGQ